MKYSAISLLETLKSKNIITELKSGTVFYDEPKLYYYTADINKDLSCLNELPYEMTAGGISADSQQKALLKCLMECIERYSLFASTERYQISSYNELDNEALDPSLYTHSLASRSKKLSWTEGYNVTSSVKTSLPAQLVNLNNKKFDKEELLTTVISTGAAGGFNQESAVLGGIYEMVERDAFMTIYLNKIKAPMVQISLLKDKAINKLLDIYRRYKLEIFVFDITHDLGIPVFLSILVDRTGIGPAITTGAKANININTAIVGSMEEAFMARPWIRYEMQKNKKPVSLLNPSISRLDRALLWSTKKNINKLNFLLRQNPIKYTLKKTLKILNKKTEFSFVVNTLQKKGYVIYCKDITASEFITDGCKIYKTIIPGLQPLYLFKQEYNLKRLSAVSVFFGQKKVSINTFPHPFL